MPELRLEQSVVDDRYEVRERLGLGSYAEIFIARDQHNGQDVVIKALNTSLQGTPDAELERTLVENFQNEAIALDAVRHPNVILRLGHGTAADLRGTPFHYLVLEYMSGGDLLHLCRTRPSRALRLSEALFYFHQVCEALAYAHHQGIIHRDLKPNNLLLSEDHQVLKIADFGVAKISISDNAEITRVGAGIYAPPEHHPDQTIDESARNHGRLTASADSYSLAKSFYTVICGSAPSQFVRRPITSLPPSVNGEPWADALLRVLRRATNDQVEARYGSVIEFWSDLASVAAENKHEAETLIRPRLQVAPSEIPRSPAQPIFNPILASINISADTKSEEHQLTPNSTRSPKIVVPIPVPQLTAHAEPNQLASPEQSRFIPRWATSESLLASLRKLTIVVFLGIAYLGLLAGTYRYARTKGLPAAVEVTAVNLNVRAGPSYQYATLGTVPRGSRHRVLGYAENGWMRIEVSQWTESLPHDEAQRQGWINGSEEYVSIVSRSWW